MWRWTCLALVSAAMVVPGARAADLHWVVILQAEASAPGNAPALVALDEYSLSSSPAPWAHPDEYSWLAQPTLAAFWVRQDANLWVWQGSEPATQGL